MFTHFSAMMGIILLFPKFIFQCKKFTLFFCFSFHELGSASRRLYYATDDFDIQINCKLYHNICEHKHERLHKNQDSLSPFLSFLLFILSSAFLPFLFWYWENIWLKKRLSCDQNTKQFDAAIAKCSTILKSWKIVPSTPRENNQFQLKDKKVLPL